MKKLTTPLLATLVALSASAGLSAAEPQSAFGLAPSAEPQLQPAPAPSNLPLIPETPEPSLVKPTTGGNTTKNTLPTGDRTTMAEDKLKKQIALRQAVTKAERDPELVALKAQAIEAHTDFEQRKLFIDYFNRLAERIAKYNPGMKKEDIAALKEHYTGRFVQTRIAPTIDPVIARAQQ
jgi:hypothetical protein